MVSAPAPAERYVTVRFPMFSKIGKHQGSGWLWRQSYSDTAPAAAAYLPLMSEHIYMYLLCSDQSTNGG